MRSFKLAPEHTLRRYDCCAWTRAVATGDLSDKLLKCAQKLQLDKAKQLVKSLSREERTVIAGRPHKDGHTALTTAMEVDVSLAFVKFLLDECGADVDQCGVVDLPDYDDDDCHIPKCQVV